MIEAAERRKAVQDGGGGSQEILPNRGDYINIKRREDVAGLIGDLARTINYNHIRRAYNPDPSGPYELKDFEDETNFTQKEYDAKYVIMRDFYLKKLNYKLGRQGINKFFPLGWGNLVVIDKNDNKIVRDSENPRGFRGLWESKRGGWEMGRRWNKDRGEWRVENMPLISFLKDRYAEKTHETFGKEWDEAEKEKRRQKAGEKHELWDTTLEELKEKSTIQTYVSRGMLELAGTFSQVRRKVRSVKIPDEVQPSLEWLRARKAVIAKAEVPQEDEQLRVKVLKLVGEGIEKWYGEQREGKEVLPEQEKKKEENVIKCAELEGYFEGNKLKGNARDRLKLETLIESIALVENEMDTLMKGESSSRGKNLIDIIKEVRDLSRDDHENYYKTDYSEGFKANFEKFKQEAVGLLTNFQKEWFPTVDLIANATPEQLDQMINALTPERQQEYNKQASEIARKAIEEGKTKEETEALLYGHTRKFLEQA